MAASGFFGSLGSNLVGALRRRVRPTETVGSPGFVLTGGQVQYKEKSAALANKRTRWEIYYNMLANTDIIAAGVWYYTNLLAGAEWTVTPSEADTSGEFAMRAERMLMQDPGRAPGQQTPGQTWPQIVAKTGMFKYYGFSLQEWVMRKDPEGYFTLDKVAVRPGYSIYGWDTDPMGNILGLLQHDPQNQKYNYLPLGKCVYAVEDTLDNSPEGFGLLRQMVESSRRLERYEQLEGWGFDTDMRNIPVMMIPRRAIRKEVGMTEAKAQAIEADMLEFAENHLYNDKRALVLDSETYTGGDDDQQVSPVRKWGLELLGGHDRSFTAIADKQSSLEHRLARIQGIEKILLGDDSGGSYALSEDKTASFNLQMNSVLGVIQTVLSRDLLYNLWMVNGWDYELMPTLETSGIDHKDIVKLAQTMRDAGTASPTGFLTGPDDPAALALREIMGMPPPDEGDLLDMEAAADEDEMEDAMMEDE